MSQQKTKSKGWPKIGTLRRSTNKAGEKYSYIKLEDNVEVYVDGVKVSMNEKRVVRLEDPKANLEGLFSRGIIDESEYTRRMESLAQNDWLKYELKIAPPRG